MKKIFLYVLFIYTVLFLLSASASASKQFKIIEHMHEGTNIEAHKNVPLWSYDGETGPLYWGKLDPSFASCEKGVEQSPVSIESSHLESDKKKKINVRYQPAAVTLMKNGHAVQAELSALNNQLTLDGKKYKLLQFHFHHPSEHTIKGKRYPMEIHFVHQDSEKRLAVLGVMVKEGRENEEISSLLKSLEHNGEIMIDLKNLVPNQSKAFQYKGSLTTPPCTEGVRWAVLETPLELSREQIAIFRNIYQNNSRPLQPLHERKITIGYFINHE